MTLRVVLPPVLLLAGVVSIGVGAFLADPARGFVVAGLARVETGRRPGSGPVPPATTMLLAAHRQVLGNS